MKNSNRRPGRRTSPGRDPVVLALQAACAFLAVAIAVLIVPLAHREVAVASLHCPAPDHAVWADSLGPWWWKGEALCGASLTIIVGTGK